MSGMRRIGFCILALILAICTCACDELTARDEAYKGLDALKACDFYGAQQHFAEAYPVLKDKPAVELGFAFSILFGALDAPDFSSLLMRLGMTSTLQEVCLNRNERPVYDTIAGEDDCLSNRSGEHDIEWPYLCTDSADCDGLSHIDPSLLWWDIVDVIQQNRNTLLRTSSMFSNAANHMSAPYTVDNMLGFRSLTIHQADLLFFAAIIKTLVFLSDVATKYETRFSVVQTLDHTYCSQQADIINRYVGIAGNSPNLSDSISLVKSIFFDIELAFVHARLLREAYDNDPQSQCARNLSIFKWTNVPYGVMDNIISFASAFRQSQVVVRDVFSPDIQIHLSALLSNLPARTMQQTIVMCVRDELDAVLGIYVQYLNQYITPPLFEPGLESFKLHHDTSYRLSSGWRRWSFADLL